MASVILFCSVVYHEKASFECLRLALISLNKLFCEPDAVIICL